ncbi:MAG: GTPase HflX [Bacilli bacterium]
MPNKKSAILVGVKLPHFTDFAQAFEELDNLALACDYYVLKKVTQTLDAPTNHYYLGSGKVSEIKAILEETGAKTAIFDTELSPVHIRNLEKALDVDIVDRTMLILQIFESRAKTKEAKLQVAVAKASYMLPRLIDHEANYDRQRAGGKANKGSGETKLEKDKRTLRNAIIKYKKELATLTEKRRVQRLQRKDKHVFSVAIVGYTNAGKSALMNQFLSIAHRSQHKKVLEKDMVFATLETSSRLISLPNLIKFIAVDTVGFVRRLPHHLIEAFKSTLEEVKEADLILHVVDISDPEFLHLLTVADEVLQSLGVGQIPVLYVLNKIDIIRKPQGELPLNHVKISALRGLGMPQLMMKISEYILQDYHPFELKIPYTQQEMIEQLRKDGIMLETDYQDDAIYVSVALPQHRLAAYEAFIDHHDLN